MPKFDVQCKRCETVKEVILVVYKDAVKLPCERCNCITWWETQAPLTNMQPDKMWAGHMTEAGYVTSGSFLKRYRKQNNLERVDRSTYEEVQKKSKNRVSEHIRKTAKQKHDIIAAEVSQLDLPSD